MNSIIRIAGCYVVFSLYMTSLTYAGLINYERRNKAVQPSTAAQPAKGASKSDDLAMWMKAEPKAANKTEKKYDVNRDGLLQTAEVKIFLRDVIDVISSKGGYTVDSDILKEYDKNKDGVINRYELTRLRTDAFSK